MSVAVETLGLRKAFGSGDTQVEAVRGVDLRVEQGEFVAVMGASGSGKSTLLHLIGGLDRPSRGVVRLGGQDLAAPDDDALTLVRRRRIGFVFQFFNLLPILTAEENVALPLVIDGVNEKEAQRRSLVAMEAVGIAHRATHRPSDSLLVETRSGPVSFSVAGTVTEYTAGGYSLYMDYATAERNFELTGADLYIVTASEGTAAALGDSLTALTEREGLLLQSQADFRLMVDEMINGVLGFLWLLIGMVFVVASLGVVNTLTMNVLEQTREIGLLRAVAMTRRQLRKMILSQALGLAAISLLPGLGVGVAVQYLLNRGTVAMTGLPVGFTFEPVVLVGTFVVALGVSLLSAYFPRAGQLGCRWCSPCSTSEAVQYE